MKSSQSNNLLRLPDSYLARSYLIATVNHGNFINFFYWGMLNFLIYLHISLGFVIRNGPSLMQSHCELMRCVLVVVLYYVLYWIVVEN